MSRDNFGHNFFEYRQRAKSTGLLYQIGNSGDVFLKAPEIIWEIILETFFQ